MVPKTLIAALAVAQRREAEARAKSNNPEEFRKRFQMVFGKDRKTTGTEDAETNEASKDTTIWEDVDTNEAPPERLPDNANINDGAESVQGGPATPSDGTGKANMPAGLTDAPGGVQKPHRAKARPKGEKPPKRNRKGSRK